MSVRIARVRACGQVTLLRQIFREAAKCGVKSIAIPAVSAGKRGFPALLAAAITLAVAATEVLASGGGLEVLVVAYGDENHLDAFECAKEQRLLMRSLAYLV